MLRTEILLTALAMLLLGACGTTAVPTDTPVPVPPADPDALTLYVFEVFGRWPGMGSVSYGFLVEVR